MASGLSSDVATEPDDGPTPQPKREPEDGAAAPGTRALGIGGIVLRPLWALVHLWRRSIQARVVIGTLALSAVLSLLAGWVLLIRVTDGLLENKRQAAISQTIAGVDSAQSTIDGA